MGKQKRKTSSVKDSIQTRLPDAELEVLACLWQQGQATARQVREMMDSYRPMAHGSVVTLLNRLEAKGLVNKNKGTTGKAFIYLPTEKPGPTYHQVIKDLVERVFRGSGVALVSSFFETHTPTAQELDQLQNLLIKLRKKRNSKGKQS